MWKISKERGPWETEAETRWGPRKRAIVVVIEPLGVQVRPKGTRKCFRLPWSFIFDKAAEAHALAERAAKKSRKGARRISRGKL